MTEPLYRIEEESTEKTESKKLDKTFQMIVED